MAWFWNKHTMDNNELVTKLNSIQNHRNPGVTHLKSIPALARYLEKEVFHTAC